MKQFLWILPLLLINISEVYLNAQTLETDSLENLLQLHRKADTTMVNLLNTTALKFYLINEDQSLEYAMEAVELANRIKYEKGKAEGLRLVGLYHYNNSSNQLALELEQQKKNAIQVEEAKHQKVVRNSLIIGSVLLALLLFVILRSFLQNRKANRILAEQKIAIESRNNKITDSIDAAQRIQKVLFPPKKMMDEILPDYFIFNKPRDIVSGDYYWLAKKEEKTILAVADCTGHGVPGAFMSLLGITFLNEIVNETNVLSANDILSQLREQVIRSLRQIGEKFEQRDGMDISLCIFNFESGAMQFAGAFSSMYLIRDRKLIELKGDNMPIGISVRKDQPFTNKEMQLERNDFIYLCTDGYADQIGGPRRKTYRSKYFKELLLNIHERSIGDQKNILEDTFENWRGDIEQIDDILIIGIRV